MDKDETELPLQVAVLASTQAGRAGLAALLAPAAEIQVVAQAARLGDLRDPGAFDAWVLMGLAPLAGFPVEEASGQALVLVDADPAAVRRLAGLGLRGWGVLRGDFSPAALQAAVCAAHEGLVVGDPGLLSLPLEGPAALEPGDPDEGSLSPREEEVLQLMARGLANKQIAEALGISPHTVKFHISSIYTRLGATNRAEAVRLGLQHGLITF